MSECCENCGGEIPTDDERVELAREMIEAMTKDFAANPDLAKKFWVMLKLASGETR